MCDAQIFIAQEGARHTVPGGNALEHVSTLFELAGASPCGTKVQAYRFADHSLVEVLFPRDSREEVVLSHLSIAAFFIAENGDVVRQTSGDVLSGQVIPMLHRAGAVHCPDEGSWNHAEDGQVWRFEDGSTLQAVIVTPTEAIFELLSDS